MADDFKANEVSERYARALFDLAQDAGEIDAVRADLKSLKAMLASSPELRRAVTSPAYSAEDKGRALVALAVKSKFDMLTAKFLGLLTQNQRAAALSGVITAYEALWAAHTGVVGAQVVSAQPLSATQLKNIKSALRTALGQDPELEARIDPSILGGLKVKVGSKLFDASLKTKLDTLKFALKRA